MPNKPLQIPNVETALFLAIEALIFYAGGWEGRGDEDNPAGFLLLRPSPEMLDDQGAVALRAVAALRQYERDRYLGDLAADTIKEISWLRPRPALVASK